MIFNDGTVENAASALAQLIQTKLDTVGYDKTLVYTITDDSNKEKGYYQVSDGDIKFDAYTDDTSYRKDNQVYVMIPQGDFSAKKIIIGRYVENEDKNKGVNYISPIDRFIPIYQNIIDIEENEKYQIIASKEAGPGRSYEIISKGDIAVTDLMDKSKSQNYIESDLTRFFLRVGLKSNLSIYNIISGDYGIGIILVSTKNKVTALPEGFWDRDLNEILEDSEGYNFNRIELDSKDMIGNIYNYSGITYQSNIYDITNIGNIVGGIIYMYQDNNFKSQGLTSISNLYDIYKPNGTRGVIELRHLNVGFGYGQEEFKNDYNLLLTPDRTQDEFYKSGSSTDKNLNLRLIQKTDNNKYEYVDLGDKVEYFENSFEVEDNKAGLGWKAIEVNEGKVNFTSKEPTKSFKALKTIVLNKEDVASNLVVESNILTYQNTDFSQNVSGIIALSCDEGTVFDFYGQDYRINDSVQARTVKTIRATLPQAREFKKIEVVWTIPTGGSMLQHPLGNELYKEYQPDNAVYNNFESIESFTITSTYETNSLTEVKLGFGIRDVYVPTYLNNKISCKIYYDGDYSYCDEGNILFAFGGYQTAGTDYKFGMFYQNPEVSCLYNYFTNDTPKMVLQAHVVNKDKTDDDLFKIAQTLECKWKGSTDTWTNQGANSESLKFLIKFKEDSANVEISFKEDTQQTSNISDILLCRINIGTIENPKHIELELPIAIGYKAQENTSIKRISGIQAPVYINYDSFGAPLNNNNSIGLKLFMSEEKEDISTFNLTRTEKKAGEWVSVINSDLKYDQINKEMTQINFTKSTDYPFACLGRIHKITLEGDATELANLPNKSIQYLCHDYIGVNYWHKLLMIDCIEQTTKSDGGLKQTWWVYYIGRISGIVLGTQFGAEIFKNQISDDKITICSSQDADSILGTVTSISAASNSTQNLPLVVIKYTNSSPSISNTQKILVNSYEKIINTLENQCKSPIKNFSGEEYLYDSNWNFKVDNIDTEGFYVYLVEDESGNIVYTSNPHSEDTSLGQMLEEQNTTITNKSSEIYLINSDTVYSFEGGKNNLTLSNYEWEKLKCMDICADLNPQIVFFLSDNSTKAVNVNLISNSTDIEFELNEAIAKAVVKIPNHKYLYWTGSQGVISLSGVKWRLKIKHPSKGFVDTNSLYGEDKSILLGFPNIITTEEYQYLQPYPFYCENKMTPYLEAYKTNEQGVELIYWHQPIVIAQDTYAYGVLNEWDGEKTNVGEGSIMSPCIGAGSKSDKNQFTGVLMGKIKDTSEQINHGLYGFSDGAQAFGFKEDGTAFIGKSGSGRILFDGDKSTIKSASYDPTTDADGNEIPGNGILLDLDNPIFDLKYNGVSLIHFDPKTEWSNTGLLPSKWPQLYLQSNGYESKTSGMRIDLQYGELEMNGLGEKDESLGEKITVAEKEYDLKLKRSGGVFLQSFSGSENDYPLNITGFQQEGYYKEGSWVPTKDKTETSFKVDWDGIAYMTGAQIDGDLNAGTVGGWNIGSSEYNGKLRKTLSCRSDYEGSLNEYAEGLYNMSLIEELMQNQSLELSLINYESFDIVNDSSGVGIPIREDIFSFRQQRRNSDIGIPNTNNFNLETELNAVLGTVKSLTIPEKKVVNLTVVTGATYTGLSWSEVFQKVYKAYQTDLDRFEIDDTGKNIIDSIINALGKSIEESIYEIYIASIESAITSISSSSYLKYFTESSLAESLLNPLWVSSEDLGQCTRSVGGTILFGLLPISILSMDNSIFSIKANGDIETIGKITLGAGSDSKISLSNLASTWKIKYGQNSSSSSFFGVALPVTSSSIWNRGIRFNSDNKSIVLNGNGFRLYNWNSSEQKWSESGIMKWYRGSTNNDGRVQIKIGDGYDLRITRNGFIMIAPDGTSKKLNFT